MLKILYPTKNNNNKTNAYFVLVLSEENIFILFVTLYLHGRSWITHLKSFSSHRRKKILFYRQFVDVLNPSIARLSTKIKKK